MLAIVLNQERVLGDWGARVEVVQLPLASRRLVDPVLVKIERDLVFLKCSQLIKNYPKNVSFSLAYNWYIVYFCRFVFRSRISFVFFVNERKKRLSIHMIVLSHVQAGHVQDGWSEIDTQDHGFLDSLWGDIGAPEKGSYHGNNALPHAIYAYMVCN